RRDQLIHPAHARVPERSLQQIEPPVALDRTGQVIAHRVAASIQIEPQLALQRQTIGRRIRLTTARTLEQQLAPALQLIRAEVPPALRQVRAQRIDAQPALQL